MTTVSGRILPATVERLDRIAATLAQRRPGEIVQRSDALRAAIERGVEVLERELGIQPAEPSTDAPATPKGGKSAARTPMKKK
ncbi:hypothetical protein [Sorangium sp. So ce117]|uniref:hypothetical protein n=1 Tax=Sorangium sp. So ce117 TaxID=3133277 RepID=UPI003F600B39